MELCDDPTSSSGRGAVGTSCALSAACRIVVPGVSFALIERIEEKTMAWSTPRVEEVCVGMEVTSYVSAEI